MGEHGGWLHDQLVTFLDGDEYCTFVPRGKEPGRYGGEPSTRWSRPVCVVQNEGNYSDAHFFPYSFRTLGIGKGGAKNAGLLAAAIIARSDPEVRRRLGEFRRQQSEKVPERP